LGRKILGQKIGKKPKLPFGKKPPLNPLGGKPTLPKNYLTQKTFPKNPQYLGGFKAKPFGG